MISIANLTKAFVALLCIPVLANVINVPDDYGSIQEGVNASSYGDTVLVQPGMYVENINFNGHSIVLGSLFLTTGDTSYISQTVIDGDSAGTVIVFDSGEDSAASLIGFYICNGNGSTDGGGIRIINSDPAITSNEICFNVVPLGQKGPGIYCKFSSSRLEDNDIHDNISDGFTSYASGGGISCDSSSLVISNNYIHHNQSCFGGGISTIFSTCTIAGNYISDNETTI